MLNKVTLIGNLGQDPEMTYTPSGVAVCKASLATTEKWTGKDGERREQTEWHNLVFWRKQAEIANEYLRKGSRIYVEGRIKYRSWDGQDGVKRYATDIEVQNFLMLGGRGESGGGGGGSRQSQSSPQRSQGQHGQSSQQSSRQQEDPGVHYEPEGNDSFGQDDSDLPF